MHTIYYRTGFGDTDKSGMLSPAASVRLLQDCAMFQLEGDEHFRHFSTKYNIGCFLVSRQIQFERMPRMGEELRITTGICACKSSYGQRNTIIYDESDTPCVIATEVGAFVHRVTGAPYALPPGAYADIVDCEPYPMDYESRKITIPSGLTFTELERTKVYDSYLDSNRHLNAVQGLQLVMKHVDFAYRKLRGNYRNQATLGETLIIDGAAVGDQHRILRLHNGEGKIFTTHEFKV